jgi:hypothetical protein
LLTGLQGGLATKIEMLKDGVIQFDQDPATATGKYNIKFVPQQIDEGNTDWNFTIISQPNSGIDRNNDVYSHGFNLNPGGGVEVANKVGFGEQFEHFYRTSGSDYGEWHIVHIDTLGTVRKPISWFLNHYDPSLWAGDFLASEIQLNDPTNNLPFIEFERANTTSASFKMLGSASGQGAEFYLDEAGDNLQITSFSLTNPHMYLFDNVGTSFVHVNYLEYLNAGTDAIRIAGQDANGYLTDVPAGWGLDLTAGTLLVDSSQVATQYDLTLISGGTTDLTIGGSGPTYTIESSTGTDVTVANLYGLTLSESPANTLNLQVDSSKLATQYDLTLISGGSDGNGLFDAANEGDTLEVSVVEIKSALGGFYFNALGAANTSYWGYEPFSGGAGMIIYDDQARSSVFIQNNHATHGTFVNLSGVGNTYLYGIASSGDFYIQDGTIEPFYIEASTTVDNTLKLQADGDVQISDYPNTRDDGTPTNILGTDASGVIQSYPVGDVTPDTDDQDITVTGASQPFTLDLESDATDATFTGAGITTVTRSGNALTFTSTEADGSTTNEAWTADADDADTEVISNQTLKFEGGVGIVTDYISGTPDKVSFIIDGDEFTDVTTPEADDWVLMHDENGAGADVLQKILWSDLYSLISGDGNGLFDAGNDGATIPTTFDADITDNLDFDNGDLYIDVSAGRIGMGTVSPTADLHVVGTSGSMRFEPLSAGSSASMILEGKTDSGQQTYLGFNYTDTDYSGVEQTAAAIVLEKQADLTQWTTVSLNMYEATDAAALVVEKNADLDGARTTESHIAMNGGVAFTQNYEWSSTPADLALDRSFYNVIVTGSGVIGDEITLPNVFSTLDNWTNTMTSTDCMVGQEYVISNFRASANLVIRTNSGDYINPTTGTPTNTTLTLAPYESVIIKCVRLNGTTGYWFSYD